MATRSGDEKTARARPGRPTRAAPRTPATARDIMRRDIVTTTRTTPLSEVVSRLTDEHISGVPVTDEAGHVVGVLSMRDVLEHYAHDSGGKPRSTRAFHMTTDVDDDEDDDRNDDFEVRDPAEAVAGDVMTAEVLSVDVDSTLPEIARSFVDNGIHRVLVKENGRFVGLIGTLDVLRAYLQS